MPNDDAVRRHRLQVARGVEKRFAFRYARCRNTDIDGIRRQTLGGNFKRRARPRRRFKEKVDDGAAPQRRDFFDLALGNIAKRFGGVEQMHDLIGRKLSYSEQVLELKICAHLVSCQLSVVSWRALSCNGLLTNDY